MSPPGADRLSSARVAILGAETPCGALLREALAEQGVPGSRVDLFGSTHGEAVISEYDGEARLIQEPDPRELGDHEVVFLCDASAAAQQVVTDVQGQGLVVDLAAARPAGHPAKIVHPDINPDALDAAQRVVAVPHPLSVVLARVLQPVDGTIGIRRAMAVAVRPASDFGERGLEELRDQTVGLLRFSDPPKEVFGRQLAFNLIPEGLLTAAAEPDLETRLVAEVSSLLAWTDARLTVALLAAPVFYGHALLLRIELAGPATLTKLLAVCRAVGADDQDAASTPIDAAGSRLVTVSQVREDGLGGYWLWVVAGEAGAAAAESAVRLVRLAGRT